MKKTVQQENYHYMLSTTNPFTLSFQKSPLPGRGKKNDREGGNPLAAASKTHPLRRGRLYVDPFHRTKQVPGERLGHGPDVRREPGALSNDRQVRIAHAESALIQGLHHPSQQDTAIDTGILVLMVRKPETDVPQGGGAQQGIAEGVDDNIAIRVGGKSLVVLDPDPAENERSPGHERMRVHTLSDPNGYQRLLTFIVHGLDAPAAEGRNLPTAGPPVA